MTSRKRSLNDLVNEIDQQAKCGDERLIATAMLVREVKQRIEAGEAGPGVKWLEWAKRSFSLSKTKLYLLNHIASSQNPAQALEIYRSRLRERQKSFQMTLRERDPERLAVIKLVRMIDIEKVRKVRKAIAALENS